MDETVIYLFVIQFDRTRSQSINIENKNQNMVPHLWFMVSFEGPGASGVMADFIFEAPFFETFHENTLFYSFAF